MGEDLKIGIVYNGSSGWTGGKNYIINLIKAIRKVGCGSSIFLFVQNEEDFNEINYSINGERIEKIVYPNSENILIRLINRISKKILKRELFQNKCGIPLDILYPSSNHNYFSNVRNKLFWIPDIQEKTYPEFFSSDELKSRNQMHINLILNGSKLVFSSKAALDDFSNHYKCNNDKFVLNFAVSIDDFHELNKNELLEKFALPKDYFYVPNQFWKHKNHKTVIRAVEYLRDKGHHEITIAFSGNEVDYRDPTFIHELKDLVKEKRIENQIKFLGFIERNDLLNLMHFAEAVIQPSLFEGWSTVVEECKMMNKSIILSDIPVHREQILLNCSFFDPFDYKQLGNLLISPIEKSQIVYNESLLVRDYGNKFIEIARQL